MRPGTAEIRKGYLYGNEKLGLGIDSNETLAAKYPIASRSGRNPYRLDRAVDRSTTSHGHADSAQDNNPAGLPNQPDRRQAAFPTFRCIRPVTSAGVRALEE